MDDKITIGHPFYFPTQAVLVDDDSDFLEGISLMLNKNLSYKLFQSATSALSYVNQAHLHVNVIQRCYTNYRTGPLESDSLTHIDIGKIHHEVLNGYRFQTCSSVIVDYSMPEMNGLEFLMSLKNPFIKKVLLTGQADMELAIKAFNQQLIDQFIDKHDPRLKQKLNATISSFQDQYFRRSFKLITDPILANNVDAFLINKEFQAYFEDLRKQLNTVEYYMIDAPHSGFLLVDGNGQSQCLLVFTQQALDEHLDHLTKVKAPKTLQDEVRNGNLVPNFNPSSPPATLERSASGDWTKLYSAARKVPSQNGVYYAALTDCSGLTSLQNNPIHSYRNFLETNSFNLQVIH